MHNLLKVEVTGNIQVPLIAPPVDCCQLCNENLEWQSTSRVTLYNLSVGKQEADKVILRCRKCKTMHNPTTYNNDGKKYLYKGKSDYVEASNGQYVHTQLAELYSNLA